MAETFIVVNLEEGEEVLFFTTTILNAAKDEARTTQHINTEPDNQSDALWRAKTLRSLADSIELEALIDQEKGTE